MNSRAVASVLFSVSLFASAQAVAGNPAFLPFQALITNSSDVPWNNTTFSGGTSMIIEILDDANQCVIYEETIPTITTDSKGMASWPIGTGGISYATGGPASLQTTLASVATYNVTSCLPGTTAAGTAQTVNLIDGRAIQFSVDNGTTWSTSTLITIGSVPYAFNADTLAGTPAANYVLTSGANPLTGNLNAGGFKINNLANPATAQDAVTLSYAQSNFAPISGNFGASNIDTTGSIGVGTAAPAANIDIESAVSDSLIIGSTGAGGTTMSLNFDANSGTTNRASIQAPANANTLNFLTGGVTAMSIAANQTVTFNNSISSAGALVLGSYISIGTVATDPLTGTVLQGTVWENNISHSMKYYDGTNNQTLVTGLTAGTGTTVVNGINPSVNVTYGTAANTALQGNTAFGGDITGGALTTNVTGLQGKALTIAAPSNGQVLSYNGAIPAWVNANVPTVPALTLGSVVFSGGATTLSQDNTKFFWDDTNHRLGLSAGAAPGNTLSVNSPTTADLNAQTMISNTAVTNTALVLQEFAGQNSNMLEVQSAGGAKLYTVEWTGLPINGTDLTPKSYVDNVTTTSASLYVRKDGSSTMTGALNLGSQMIENVSQLGVGVAGVPASTLDLNGAMRFEGSTSGYVGFKSAATVATPVTWTFPAGDGGANQVLSTNGSGTLAWASGVANFTGTLAGDVTGTQSATLVQAVGGSTAPNIHLADLAVQGATSAISPNTMVKRDPSGSFSGATITGVFNDNGPQNMNGFPINNVGNPVGPQDAATMNFVMGTESMYVPLTGGNMTGPLTLPPNDFNVGAGQFDVTTNGIGVGTTAPVGQFDIYNLNPTQPQLVVQGGGSIGAALTLDSTPGGNRIYTVLSTGPGNPGGSGNFLVMDDFAGQARLVINPGGNIGIGGVTAPMVSLDDSARTDAIALPRGPTGSEPPPVPGYFRYNTSLNALEFFNGGTWVNVSGTAPSRTPLTIGGGTYNTPPGARQLRVRMIGGGGGSGGTNSTNISNGGGAGEYVEFFINTPAASYPYQVGPGGSGGVANSPTGGPGSPGVFSSFGPWTANGGNGGGGGGTTIVGTGGTGGSGAGQPRIQGGNGAYAGAGGSGAFGVAPGNGGGANAPSTFMTNGNTGGMGLIIIDEIY